MIVRIASGGARLNSRMQVRKEIVIDTYNVHTQSHYLFLHHIMPLFGRKTKHAEDALQARNNEANATQASGAGGNQDASNISNGGSSGGPTANRDRQSNDPTATNGPVNASNVGNDTGSGAGRELGGTHAGDTHGAYGEGINQTEGGGIAGSNNYTGSKHLDTHHGSSALREHGLRLEREAEALHNQSAEIAEAERLEQEAREHRERAVASGADPIYRQPGTAPHDLD